jgi:hypothetical protein
VQTAVERVVAVPGVVGAVAIAGETMAAAGEVSLAPVA